MNLKACKATFLNNQTYLALYSHHGPERDVTSPGDRHFITLAACEQLCGTGIDIYPWSLSANTILTWVLPKVLMFLLAPFESNQARNTFVTTVRWIGSPFISMWYVLCNIKTTARCAEMVDMAVAYKAVPDEGSDFGDFRDAMIILSSMNQFFLNSELYNVRRSHRAERVLRTALFGKLALPGQSEGLPQRRAKIATSMRAKRRRGVVPTLIGLMWFLFILALSIHASRYFTMLL